MTRNLLNGILARRAERTQLLEDAASVSELVDSERELIGERRELEGEYTLVSSGRGDEDCPDKRRSRYQGGGVRKVCSTFELMVARETSRRRPIHLAGASRLPHRAATFLSARQLERTCYRTARCLCAGFKGYGGRGQGVGEFLEGAVPR